MVPIFKGLLLLLVLAHVALCQVSTAIDEDDEQSHLICVPIHECPSLVNLLKKKPISFDVQEFLKKSNCGFVDTTPKVWCFLRKTTCKTASSTEGTCVPLEKCQAYAKTKRNLNLKEQLRQDECNSGDGLMVCCPNDFDASKEEDKDVKVPEFLPKPSENQCGRQSLGNKLVGGTQAEIDEFPWTALLRYNQEGEIAYGCGGALISNRHVITAAHCVDKSAQRRLGDLESVVLGEYDLKNETDCVYNLNFPDCSDPTVAIMVEIVTIHPEWDKRIASVVNNDIALIRMAATVEFTDFIQPICLPSPTFTVQDKEKLIVAGWGQTETGQSSEVKLKLTVPAVSKQSCFDMYNNSKGITIGDGMFCAGGETGKDSCTGDSGGPLMITTKRNQSQIWFLAGVVSFGYNAPCGEGGFPGVYTFLPRYMQWIYKNIKA